MGKPASTVVEDAVRSSLYVDHDAGGFQFSRQDSQDISEIRDFANEMLMDGGSRTTQIGKSELLIPTLVLRQLKKKYPDLDSPDRMTKVRAWKKFLASTESKPWRTSRPKYI